MAMRTIKILGLVNGDTPATVEITANGNTVFSGEVVSNHTPILLPTGTDVPLTQFDTICTFEIDTAFSGGIPMSCRVLSGTVVFTKIVSNYSYIANPALSSEQLEIIQSLDSSLEDIVAVWELIASPALTAEELNSLKNPAISEEDYNNIVSTHKLTANIIGRVDDWEELMIDKSDPRVDVKINDVEQTPNRRDAFAGSWYWNVPAGSSLSYLLTIPAL